MTSFKINSDDQAVRGLQSDNKTPVISGPVLPVKASNPVEKSPENTPLQKNLSSNSKQLEQAHSHRRHQDRRKESRTLLFDTRSKHDRRVNEDIEESEHHLHGIDKIV